MKRPKPMRAQMGSLLQVCVDTAGRAGMGVARRVVARLDRAAEDGPGQRVVDAITRGTERIIEKSPVPIPGPVRDALGRMQEALGQLSHSIETVNAGASSLARDTPQADAERRQAIEDAKAAFAQFDAEGDDSEATEAPAKKRRHRSRRNHRSGDETNEAQSAKKDRATQTPSN